MLNSYYQEELRNLRELGLEFAEVNPELAGMLAHGGADPDVERLLQGFAFLSGRIRRKLDDDLPEVVRSLMEMVSPQSVRALPSFTILEMEARDGLRACQTVPAGVALESKKVDGARLRFCTTEAVELTPLRMKDVELRLPQGGAASLHLTLRPRGKLTFEECLSESLRLHCSGDFNIASELYRVLVSQVTAVYAVPPGRRKPRVLVHEGPLSPVGFGVDTALVPQAPNSVPGHWLLQEYFAFPAKFMFVDLPGMRALADPLFENEDEIELVFELSEAPDGLQRVSVADLRLHCAPAVNLFESTAQPINIEEGRSRYRLRPENPATSWVYSVQRVSGIERLTAREIEYPSYMRAAANVADGGEVFGYHHVEVEPADTSNAPEYHLRFLRSTGDSHVPKTDSLSIEMMASNGRLPEALRAGDINQTGPGFPSFARGKNLTKPTDAVDPPLDSGLHRRLLSHLSLGIEPMASVSALREVVSLFDTPGLRNHQARKVNARRIEGLREIETRPTDTLYRGAVLRGIEIKLIVKSSNFVCRGDLYLLTSILDRFFGLHVSVNQFSRLVVEDEDGGPTLRWPVRSGSQFVL